MNTVDITEFKKHVKEFHEWLEHLSTINRLDMELIKKHLTGLYEMTFQITLQEQNEYPETEKPVVNSEHIETTSSDLTETPTQTPNNLSAGPELPFEHSTTPDTNDTKEVEPEKPEKKSPETSFDTNSELPETIHDIIAKMQQSDDRLTLLAKQQISALTKAISINDKIEFVRELFAGDANRYKDAITKLDACANLNEAINFLNELNLDFEKPSTEKLVKLVYRRFA